MTCFKDLLSKAISLFLFGFLGNLPICIRNFLGEFIGRISRFFLTREVKIATAQLNLFFDKEQSNLIVVKLFKHIGSMILESINTFPIIKNGEFNWASISGVSKEEVSNLNKGALALTAHIGNWDLLGSYFSNLGLEVATIGRKARNPIAHFLLEKLRSRNKIFTLWRTEKSNAREVLSLFKNKKIVAALIDQDTVVRSTFSKFMGIPSKTPSGLIELAQRLSIPIYTVFLIKEGFLKYKIFIERIDTTMSEQEILDFYHTQLENCIKIYPWQWMWFHKRWRSFFDGTTMGTKDYLVWLKSRQTLLFVSSLFLLTTSIGCGIFDHEPTKANLAELALTENQYQQAIDLYLEHIDQRRKDPGKEEWENPSFYYLLIGDIYLKEKDWNNALAYYKKADNDHVDHLLFLDRMRLLGAFLEEQKQYNEALKLLTPLAKEDPVLINEILDRVSKKSINGQ